MIDRIKWKYSLYIRYSRPAKKLNAAGVESNHHKSDYSFKKSSIPFRFSGVASIFMSLLIM